jgi:hypothetical protein
LWQHATTAARRILAGAAILSVAIWVARSYMLADAEICRGAADSSTGVIRLCGPAGLQDVPSLGVFLLVAVLLLLPDLSEVSIPGLLTLKRAVAEQEKKTTALADQVSQMSIRLQQVNTVNNIIFPPGPEQAAADVERRDAEFRQRGAEASKALEAATKASDSGVDVETDDKPPLALPAKERALAEVEITRLWEGIDELDPVERRRGLVRTPEEFTDPLFQRRMDLRMQWFEFFRDDLASFRIMRNTVVHQPRNLTDEQVQAGVLLGRRLFTSLRDWISRGP